MSLGAARSLTALWFTLMLLAVIWPGAVPASRIEPTLLGLPFAFAWPALWVAASVIVLWALDRVEGRHRKGGPALPVPGEAAGAGLASDDGDGPRPHEGASGKPPTAEGR